MTLHKPVIYGLAIEAAQASSVPSRAMTTPLLASRRAIPSGSPFATPLASPFGSIEPVLLLKEYSHDRSAQTPTRHLRPSCQGPR